MKAIVLLLVTVVMACGLAPQSRNSSSEQMRIASTLQASPELWQKVRQHGIIRLIVDLNVPVQSEARISPEEQHAQRKAIAEIQDMLLAELAGTKI